MRLRALSVAIPFKEAFTHAAATRTSTSTFIVLINEGEGIGESCPRPYVTGETLQTCFSFFDRYQQEFSAIDSIDSLFEVSALLKDDISKNLAAWCAIELSLLDYLGKKSGGSIEEILGLSPLISKVTYDGVLGGGSFKSFYRQLEAHRSLGVESFKVKLSGNLELDNRKLDTLNGFKVRADANNFFENASEFNRYLSGLNVKLSGIEEPVRAKDFSELGLVQSRVILDESVTDVADLDHVPADSIINIRVSKLGGVIRSVQLAERAISLGFKLIIGSQVGESSILTRAGLCLASQFKVSIVGCEGAYSEHLISEDICSPLLKFGSGGSLCSLCVAKEPGLGLTPELGVLDRFKISSYKDICTHST